MHYHGIEWTESFYTRLASAEGQKLEYFKWTANNIFKH
jgi:hypothetical protein